MKSLLTSFLCASFLVLAVGCGKDNKSGGNNNYSNLYNTGLSYDSRAVLDKLTAWHQGVNEGTAILGLRNVLKKELNYNTQPTCEQKKFLGIPYTLCQYSGSATQERELSNQMVNLVQDGRKLADKGNNDLNEALNGSQGTLVSAVDITAMRSELTFLRADGIVVTYLIDRGYHSAVNPIKKSETSQSSRREVITSVY
jgi:hypothetical protein